MTATSRIRHLAAVVVLALAATTNPAVVTSAVGAEGTVASASAMSMLWPKSPVPTGQTVTLTGDVSPAEQRPVVLEFRPQGSTAFTKVTSTVSFPDGSFRLSMSSDVAATLTVRVTAPATETETAVSLQKDYTFVAPEPEPEPDPEPTPEPEPDKQVSRANAALSATTARIGARVYLTGKVTGPGRRPIRVVQKLPSGWHTVARGRTAATGRYKIKAPTTWYGRHRYAVLAPATATHQAVRSTAQTLRVRLGYRPAGSARAWSHLAPGMRFRFDPCQVITYRVNTDRSTPGALADVKGAFARISRASGLRFRYLGGTKATPMANREGRAPKDADIVIAWQYRRNAHQLGGAAGIGGPRSSRGTTDARGSVYEIDWAAVLLAADMRDLKPGFGATRGPGWHGTRGQLLMHEITHALGIGHTEHDAAQIMYPTMTSKPARFGAGDLTALRRVGLAAGCITGRR